MKKIITLTMCFFAGTLINMATVGEGQGIAVKCVPSCSFIVHSNSSTINLLTYDVYGNRLTDQINLQDIEGDGKLIMNNDNPLAPGILVLKSSPE